MQIFIFKLLSKLPLSVLHAIGALGVWPVYWFAKGFRKRFLENIKAAGYEKHLSQALMETGKTLAELPHIWGAPLDKVMENVKGENCELITEALKEGKGIIFFTPHMGCFEITAQLGVEYVPLTVMYQPPKDETYRELYEQGRTRGKLKLAQTNLSGIRTMARALKRGEAIGILPDHVPKLGDGVWAEFLGRPAYTMTLAAKLHQMSGAPILTTYAERLPHGKGYIVHFYRFDGSMEGLPEEQARAINASIEKLIEHCPAQYLWSYSRFRKPRQHDKD